MDVGLTNWSAAGGGWTEEVDDVKKLENRSFRTAELNVWRLAGCGSWIPADVVCSSIINLSSLWVMTSGSGAGVASAVAQRWLV